ncbi:hypothetical protein D9613_004882 [Agrocybe pediades]|uniref:Arrestin-like N-terminal domain-containing protein n=1 Tax=Agrocybe pediades TaxID=84607 RepID=A0A8H4QXG0_9AGAR|nr:hypothetical protein D9613_004882 [Agrocybe pediades]
MGVATRVNSASDRVIAAAERLRPTQHDFNNAQPGTAAWAILRLFTRPSMAAAPKYPRFYGGDHVKGEVLLSPTRPRRSIASITVLLRGTIKTGVGSGGTYCFLEYTHQVWDPTVGPSQPGNTGLTFSFPFPECLDYGSPSGRPRPHSRTLHRTPQTTFAVDAQYRIEYVIILKITHSDVHLNEVSDIKSKVFFIPAVTPGPPSIMRQEAYSRNLPLPGPHVDPQGWVTLPALSVVGFFRQQRVKLDYALHLASPLSYTRGTCIPCYLSVSGEDAQPLDSLTTPEMLYMRLVRYTRFFEDPAKGTEQYLNNQQPRVLEKVEEVGRATWWFPSGVQQERRFRRLEGEIYLEENLSPTSNFLPLAVKYKVEFLPFNHLNSRTFRQSEVGDDQQRPNIMLSHSVTIATVAADGPPQRTSSHPRQSSPQDSSSNQGGTDRVRDWVRSQGN